VSAQRFRYLCVLDFEAVWDERGEAKVAEVIEYPCVLLNVSTLAVEDEFHSYVRPVLQRLNAVCVRNTGIQPEWVEKAALFRQVYAAHLAWLRGRGLTEEEVCVVTCGDWDLKHMLPRQLHRENPRLPYPPLMRRWINVKVPFTAHYKRRRQQGMASMLGHLRIPLTGRHHSGLDDCRNTTKLVVALLLNDVVLTPTNSLE
jgi:inhibitor of KinA sporulation pathway (predicted exonuclease)